MLRSLVGSEMCIRDRSTQSTGGLVQSTMSMRLVVLTFTVLAASVASVIDCRADNTTSPIEIEITNKITGPVKIAAAQNDHVGYIVCEDGFPASAVDRLIIGGNTTYVLFAFKVCPLTVATHSEQAPNSGECELWPKPGVGFPHQFNITRNTTIPPR
eukprot:TRINITY_DN1639_c0_g1_i8.p1 TRINITY_DN1639_c0_g1~~TRINITY_DN1639_c0_g1_i8.p1  ORF type:complete len:157 (-),score=39.70 TRINITY_DN1639_c0_g1_i8:447-917(-)